MGRNIAVYIDFFVIEYIPQKLLNKIKNKSVTHIIFRIQDNGSIMRAFYCNTFIEDTLAGKSFLDYTDLFFPNDYQPIY